MVAACIAVFDGVAVRDCFDSCLWVIARVGCRERLYENPIGRERNRASIAACIHHRQTQFEVRALQDKSLGHIHVFVVRTAVHEDNIIRLRGVHGILNRFARIDLMRVRRYT